MPTLNFTRQNTQNNVQSIVFSKQYFTIKQAKSWLKRHHYRYGNCDEKENTIRFRQFDPRRTKKYRYKSITEGIKFVLEY